MSENYWRVHGAYLIGSGCAQIAGWGIVGLATLFRFDEMAGFGGLVIIASGLIFFAHAFWALLIALMAVLAVLTIVGAICYALSSLLHPALLIAIGVAAVAFGVTYAGALWADHGERVVEFVSGGLRRARRFRNRTGVDPPPLGHGPAAVLPGRPPPFQAMRPILRLRRAPRPMTLVAAARRRRRCRLCGSWIEADQPRCVNRECPSTLGEE